MPSTGSGIIYHYCSLEAFKSIIENKCLWLCDVGKSNDSKECSVLPETFRTLVENSDELNAMTEQRPLLDRMLHMACNAARQTFVSCFSRKRDDLNQWRGYAADGTGLCIGFRKQYFEALNLPEWNVLTYAPVDYSPQGATHSGYHYFHRFTEMMKEFHAKQIAPLNSEALSKENELLHMIWSHAPIFKRNAFHEEEEERLVLSVPNYAVDLRSLASNNSFSVHINRTYQEIFQTQTAMFSLSKLKYRSVRSTLQGYYELSFAPISDSIISEIIIGPKCQLSPIDVYIFLASNGYHKTNDPQQNWQCIFLENDLNIISSELSYQ